MFISLFSATADFLNLATHIVRLVEPWNKLRTIESDNFWWQQWLMVGSIVVNDLFIFHNFIADQLLLLFDFWFLFLIYWKKKANWTYRNQCLTSPHCYPLRCNIQSQNWLLASPAKHFLLFPLVDQDFSSLHWFHTSGKEAQGRFLVVVWKFIQSSLTYWTNKLMFLSIY